jgi:hypothetical protein
VDTGAAFNGHQTVAVGHFDRTQFVLLPSTDVFLNPCRMRILARSRITVGLHRAGIRVFLLPEVLLCEQIDVLIGAFFVNSPDPAPDLYVAVRVVWIDDQTPPLHLSHVSCFDPSFAVFTNSSRP